MARFPSVSSLVHKIKPVRCKNVYVELKTRLKIIHIKCAL